MTSDIFSQDTNCKLTKVVFCFVLFFFLFFLSKVPEVIKKIFMPDSAEHEIFSTNKYENANNSWHFRIY